MVAHSYTDLNYSPREGEVRTYLTDWANYSYTVSRDTIAKKYPLNYYFLSQNLAAQLMGQDNQNNLVSQVVGGQIEQSDVEVKNVTITTMSEETVQNATISRGTALVTIDKLYSPRNSHDPRTEHWLLSVTYYLNPKQVSDQARVFPQFETINPLGLTITEFHENRMSVDPIAPGSSAPVASLTRIVRGDETGAPMKVQQELMRHASIQTTMNVYGQAMSSSKREANGKVVEMVLKPLKASA
jgi:type IV secretion system protein VirB5